MANETREMLDRWAAKHLGEEGSDVEDAVSSEWYTSSPGAAFVVLSGMAEDGKEVKLEIDDEGVEVYCGEVFVKGKIKDLAELIVTACYRCANG